MIIHNGPQFAGSGATCSGSGDAHWVYSVMRQTTGGMVREFRCSCGLTACPEVAKAWEEEQRKKEPR